MRCGGACYSFLIGAVGSLNWSLAYVFHLTCSSSVSYVRESSGARELWFFHTALAHFRSGIPLQFFCSSLGILSVNCS